MYEHPLRFEGNRKRKFDEPSANSMECSIFEFSSKFTFKESDREVEHRRERILIHKKKVVLRCCECCFCFIFFISSVCFITFAGKMSILSNFSFLGLACMIFMKILISI